MKKIVFAVALMVGMIGTVSAANLFDTDPNRIGYIGAGKMTVVKLSLTAANTVNTIAANPNRVDGWIVCTGTTSIYGSGVATSTTAINANGFKIKAADATGDDDKFFFRQGNWVYTGPVYITNFTDSTEGYYVEFSK